MVVNIRAPVRNTIPGIETGNPGCISSGCVLIRVTMIFAERDILSEHLGRKLKCECQVLYDERELRKEALKRQFGVDLDSGEVGLMDLNGNAHQFSPNIRFRF
jgi:hypothetical protein